MKKYLVTGAAGFIGANFVKYMLSKYENIYIVILDKLTYAGNLGTIKNEIEDSRVEFVLGDICDKEKVSEIFAKHDIDYVVNFAAESHVDRSITNQQLFLETNILGTQNMLECAKQAWTTGQDSKGYPTYKDGKDDHSHLVYLGAVTICDIFVKALAKTNDSINECFLDLTNLESIDFNMLKD